jgi:ribose transport system ATP-binding protein
VTLKLSSVSKTFAGQMALRDVGLDVGYGEVRALVGQNGSGKSTLIKLLAGYHQPDPGAVAEIAGRPFDLGNAGAARARGLRFVHQDLALVLSMSVLDNIMLGRDYPRRFGAGIAWRRAREEARTQLRLLAVDVDPDTPVAALSMAERTAVAISRALADTQAGERLFIVLDEPTAALPQNEVGRLLGVIDRLRGQGHGVLLVSHHLNEVLDVSDTVTVLRDGRVVAAVPRSQVDYGGLTELIVGHAVIRATSAERDAAVRRADSVPALSVRDLRGARVHELSLDVHPGEIVGVAGITGSGRESLAPLLIGRLPRTGEVRVHGRLVRAERPKPAIDAGIASIPGERARFGVFANMSVRGNLTISGLGRHRRWSRIQVHRERAEVQEWIDRLRIVTRGADAPISSLSGGNQQKVLVGRALRMQPKVLVLDDPTQGIDIGARAQIHDVIEQCAADGMAVLLISTDSDELARLADQVIVLTGGRVGSRLLRGPELTENAIDRAQLGMGSAAAAS